MSYVVTISFASAERADEWMEEHGIEGGIKEGARTTVIRMG